MRIGIDARFYNPEASGLARYATELVPRLLNLPQAGEHHFVVFLPNTVDEPTTKHPHTTFVRTNIKHYTLAEQTAFNTLLNDHHLDLMHFLHFNHPLRYKGTSIFTIHDLILTFYPGVSINRLKLFAYERIIRHALKSAAHIIAVSQNTKREVSEHYHVNPDKITVIYEAVDQRYKRCDNQRLLTQAQKKYGIDKPYVLFVGQLRVHKNIVRLIEAFASVHARNRNLQLVLVGNPDPHYLPLVQQAIDRLRLKKDVILTGFTPEEDLPLLYSAAICSVTPSLIEGFGLPPLESMACGCPVVCSNASCLPEIAGDGALYFNPTDAVDMAATLHKIVSSPNLRSILAKAGYERIKMFSWDTMAEQTLRLYDSYNTQ